jgi:hypothetical protein
LPLSAVPIETRLRTLRNARPHELRHPLAAIWSISAGAGCVKLALQVYRSTPRPRLPLCVTDVHYRAPGVFGPSAGLGGVSLFREQWASWNRSIN